MLSLSSAKWTRILVPLATFLLLLAAACGGDDDGGNDGDGIGDTATPTAPVDGIQSQPDSLKVDSAIRVLSFEFPTFLGNHRKEMPESSWSDANKRAKENPVGLFLLDRY